MNATGTPSIDFKREAWGIRMRASRRVLKLEVFWGEKYICNGGWLPEIQWAVPSRV